MQPKAIELKVSPLLATPSPAPVFVTKAKTRPPQGRAGTVRTSERMPNVATLASLPASPLGVNGANRAKRVHYLKFHS